jgi:hypothetical protein
MTRQRSALLWIACLAILFNAFAPIMAQAQGHAGGMAASMQMEVCTALGMEVMSVPLDAGRPGAAAADGHKGSAHCGYCVVHGSLPGLPASLPRPAAVSVADAVRPAPSRFVPHTLFPWSPAQARAPPAKA